MYAQEQESLSNSSVRAYLRASHVRGGTMAMGKNCLYPEEEGEMKFSIDTIIPKNRNARWYICGDPGRCAGFSFRASLWASLMEAFID